MLGSSGFDLWANDYDKSVNLSDESNDYPFAGYKALLNQIYKEVRSTEGATVLDIGFGTGILTTQLYSAGCKITGIDFSDNMIDIATGKMPKAELIKYDFSKGLPDEIKNHHFDYIISTYAMHHLIDTEKICFIKSLSALLNKKGKILIGDVSFYTRAELNSSKEKYGNKWDYDEFYFIAAEMINNLSDKYNIKYLKMSHCAGILTITNKEN